MTIQATFMRPWYNGDTLYRFEGKSVVRDVEDRYAALLPSTATIVSCPDHVVPELKHPKMMQGYTPPKPKPEEPELDPNVLGNFEEFRGADAERTAFEAMEKASEAQVYEPVSPYDKQIAEEKVRKTNMARTAGQAKKVKKG